MRTSSCNLLKSHNQRSTPTCAYSSAETSIHTVFQSLSPSILLLFLASVLFFACGEESAPGIDNAEPDYLIPRALDDEGQPVYDRDRLYVKDYSHLLHAVSIMATVSRESEYGNPAYRPDLYPDGMEERAERWLSMVAQIDNHFNDDGRIFNRLEPIDGGYSPSGEIDLSIYPDLVYAYHIHHRSGRFDHNPVLYERLNREASNYLVSPGRYLLDEHYSDGAFQHHNGHIDHRSMSFGLGGIHGHAYSWVVWGKPGGEDNMGMLPENALEHWLGYSSEEMAGIYRKIADQLDDAWDESRSIYDFGDGHIWDLNSVGAMIRGKKAMYDVLYMFGKEQDMETARRVFDRTVAMLETVIPLAKPWGLPDRIEFTPDGARPASEIVTLADWYGFLNHLGGGYGFDREREGTSMLITRYREDLFDVIGEISDNALQGALDYHLDDRNRLVTAVGYDDGLIIDDQLTIATAGMFITTAGNIYRKGSAFERASDWNTVTDEVAERSRRLFDLKFDHFEELEERFLLNP